MENYSNAVAISSISIVVTAGQKKGSPRTIILGAAVGTCAIVALTFSIAAGIICFKGGLFGISSRYSYRTTCLYVKTKTLSLHPHSYSVKNISVWDMMTGKNKGLTLLDLIIRVEYTAPDVDRLSSYYSDSILSDPKIVWEIRRPYSDSEN